MESLERYLLVSAIVLFAFVFYRWLLKYLRRNDLQGTFPYVFPFSFDEKGTPTEVKFELPASSEVKAVLFDLNGVEQRELFKDNFQKGTHSRDLDFRGVEQGEYMIKIIFPNQSTERMVKIRP